MATARANDNSDDIWNLPGVTEVNAVRVRYPSPRPFVIGREVVRRSEAVEITIRTAGAVPVRALSPVLVVGETVLSEVEGMGNNRLRFYGLDPSSLREGAQIAFGWFGMPSTWKPTPFRYRLGSPPNVA